MANGGIFFGTEGFLRHGVIDELFVIDTKVHIVTANGNTHEISFDSPEEAKEGVSVILDALARDEHYTIERQKESKELPQDQGEA